MLSQIACKYRSHAYLHAQSNQLLGNSSFQRDQHTRTFCHFTNCHCLSDQIYDFYAFALPDLLTRSSGMGLNYSRGRRSQGGNKNLLVALSDLSGFGDQFNISENNTDKTHSPPKPYQRLLYLFKSIGCIFDT